MANTNKPRPDLYEILGVSHTASQQQIYDAYSKKYHQYNPANHADNKDMWQRNFDNVIEAYRVLGDPQARSQYDAQLNTVNPTNVAQQTGATVTNTGNTTLTVRQYNSAWKAVVGVILAAAIMTSAGISIYHFFFKDKDFKGLFNKDNKNDKEITTEATTEEDNKLELYEFTDPADKEQLTRRIATIKTIFSQAGVEYSEEEIERHILFINGKYYTKTDAEAYDVMNEILVKIGEFSTATKDVVNFAGGVEDKNTVKANSYMGAYLVDTTDHADVINTISNLHVKLFTAKTDAEIKSYAKQMFDIQAKLSLGFYVDSKGNEVGYYNMTEAERFVVGIMFQTAAPVITSALGESYQITIEYNGETYVVTRTKIEGYYNPACDSGDISENEWAKAYNGLVSTSVAGKKQADGMELIYN